MDSNIVDLGELTQVTNNLYLEAMQALIDSCCEDVVMDLMDTGMTEEQAVRYIDSLVDSENYTHTPTEVFVALFE